MFEELGVRIDLERKVGECSSSERKWISLARALLSNPDLLILDEVTAYFGREDTKKLFRIIKDLKSEGKTIVFISHRLDEVFEISDEVIALRNGILTGTFEKKNGEFPQEKIITAMMGGEEKGITFPRKGQ